MREEDIIPTRYGKSVSAASHHLSGRRLSTAIRVLDTLFDVARLASRMPKGASMRPTFFGAALVDMDLTKLALSLQDVMDTLRGVDPTYYGMAAGGALGGLGTLAATEKEDPNRAAKILTGLSLGAAGGGMLGRYLSSGSASSETPKAREAARPAAETGRVVRSPVTRSADLPAGVRARAISGAEADSRLQQSEQAIRQQAAQQMDQAVMQSAATRERAALLKDQGRVQARLQAFVAPGAPVSRTGGPRNIVIGPGVRQIPMSVMKRPAASPMKMAESNQAVLSFLASLLGQ